MDPPFKWRKIHDIKMTPIEYKLLKELIFNAGVVLEYDGLLSKVWGKYAGSKNYLYDYISRLRKKIEPDANHPKYILTIPGFGYRFDDEI
jgi:two-component system, OmpR family, KDP operon response regulator KdpE